MIGEHKIMVGYETLMSTEEKEKLKEGFVRQPLDHSTLLVSPEIERQIGSNPRRNTKNSIIRN